MGHQIRGLLDRTTYLGGYFVSLYLPWIMHWLLFISCLLSGKLCTVLTGDVICRHLCLYQRHYYMYFDSQSLAIYSLYFDR